MIECQLYNYQCACINLLISVLGNRLSTVQKWTGIIWIQGNVIIYSYVVSYLVKLILSPSSPVLLAMYIVNTLLEQSPSELNGSNPNGYIIMSTCSLSGHVHL